MPDAMLSSWLRAAELRRAAARYCGKLTRVFSSSTSRPAELMVSFSRFFSRRASLRWSIVSQREFLVLAS
jgi:hypothetical protein